MTEPYFNPQVHGLGLEGFLNYANTLVNGWFVNLFLAIIWIVTVYTLSKSEWKMSGIVSFAFFITFMSAMIMRLFTQVSEFIIFGLAVGLAASVFWAIITGKT
jgi:hypothetical protein